MTESPLYAPKIVASEKLNMEFISKQDTYVIDIEIIKVSKHRQLPLIVKKVNGLNKNDTKIDIEHPHKITVDNIFLIDLIEVQ